MIPEPGLVTAENWVLLAQLTEEEGEQSWEAMAGFTYKTREELQDVYDRHFAAIEGQGCRYRFMHIVATSDVSYHEPDRSATKEESL